MALGFMQAGQKIELGGIPHQLDRLIGEEWQLLNIKTHKATQIKSNDFYEKYASGEISFQAQKFNFIPDTIKINNSEKVAAHLDLFDKASQEKMKQRRIFLESILKQFGDTRSQRALIIAIKKCWNQVWGNAPTPSTVARWLKRYVESGKDIRSLGSGDFRKGNTTNRYPPEVTEFCSIAIGKIYLQLSRGSVYKTLVEAERLVRAENQLRPEGSKLPTPTYSYIRTIINRIPEFDKFLKRYGKTAAAHKYRNAVHGVICTRPLQRVEIDHTQLDIILVDEQLGVPIARPWMTVAVDVYTRAILGFSVSYDPPSHMTVARVLKMALLPKVKLDRRWSSINRTWNMFGVMENLVVDNGFEFHGASLEAACFQLGINLSFCPRKKSWWKAHIERVIGTMNRAVTDGMPGRTFSNIKEKAEYSPVEHAALTLETMEEIIAKWVVDIYHETTHSELGFKPREAWTNAIAIEDIPLVANTNDLDAVVGIVAIRSLTHKGIELNNLRYNSEELGQIRQQFGNLKDVVVKWNPEDLGSIHIYVPDGLIIRVPVVSSQAEYATGLTHYRHLAYKNYSKKHLESHDDLEALSIAKAELQELAEQGMHATSKKTRVQNHRLIEKRKPKPIEKITSPKNESLSSNVASLAKDTPRKRFDVTLSNRNVNRG